MIIDYTCLVLWSEQIRGISFKNIYPGNLNFIFTKALARSSWRRFSRASGTDTYIPLFFFGILPSVHVVYHYPDAMVCYVSTEFWLLSITATGYIQDETGVGCFPLFAVAVGEDCVLGSPRSLRDLRHSKCNAVKIYLKLNPRKAAKQRSLFATLISHVLRKNEIHFAGFASGFLCP